MTFEVQENLHAPTDTQTPDEKSLDLLQPVQLFFDVQASLTLMLVLRGLSKHLSSFKVFQILPGKLSGSKKTILGCQTLILRKFCPKLMQDVHSFNLINHRKRKPTLKYVKRREKESLAKKPE